jgi:AcrR family transcriptional regulator
MARPRSDDKRAAILAAAARVIAREGLGAATADIAREARVSNGSLFTYFETKADLLNVLYIELKTERAEAALEGLSASKTVTRKQSLQSWSNTLRWAVANPDKRRALTHLGVSPDITMATRQKGHVIMADIARMIDFSRANGPMKNAPLEFVVGMMTAVSDATIEFMVRDRKNAAKHCVAGFEAFWRMIA